MLKPLPTFTFILFLYGQSPNVSSDTFSTIGKFKVGYNYVSKGMDVSNSGKVVGFAWIGSGKMRPVSWSVTEPLTVLDDSIGNASAISISADDSEIILYSQSSGSYFSLSDEHGLQSYTPSAIPLPTQPNPDWQVTGATDDGQILIGWSFITSSGYAWSEEKGEVLLGNISPTDISNDGKIIVGSYSSRPVIWDEQNGVRDLTMVVESDLGINLSGWSLLTVTAISENGLHITGYAKNSSSPGNEGFLISRHPECKSDW
jgi:uncharacterized membrane protein